MHTPTFPPLCSYCSLHRALIIWQRPFLYIDSNVYLWRFLLFSENSQHNIPTELEGFFFSLKILSTIFQQSFEIQVSWSPVWLFPIYLGKWSWSPVSTYQVLRLQVSAIMTNYTYFFLLFFLPFFFFFFLVSVSTLWMAWKFYLCLPQTNRILPLCFLSAGIKLVYHNTFQHTFFIFIVWIKLCLV